MASHDLSNFELIAHIGSGKTGSSSIQKTLSSNAETLKDHKVHYLGLMCEQAPEHQYSWQKPAGWPEWLKLPPERAGHELLEVLAKSIGILKESGISKAIWSNESIFGNHQKILPILHELHKMGAKISIIVYIRRHDSWLRSAYLQWGLKHKTYKGPVKSFNEWIKTQGVNFSGGLKPWIEADWINLAVRNFDTCDDVVRDFLAYYEIDAGIALKRENETPHPVALSLWATFNSQFEEPMLPVHLQRLLQQSGILDQEPIDCDFGSLLPSDADIADASKTCEEDKHAVNTILERFGQPPLVETPLSTKQYHVNQNQINAALLLMLKKQNEQINSLRNRLLKLEGNNE